MRLVALPDSIYNTFQPGDIIIRKGGVPLSHQLMQISKENYSHCGVIVRDNNKWKLIQSISQQEEGGEDGVQLTALKDFVKYTVDSTLFVCRPIITENCSKRIVEQAYFYLSKKIPFDHRFDLADDSKFYCSELLLHIFMDVFGEIIFKVRPQHRTFVPLFETFFDVSKFLPVYQLRK